MAIVTGTLRELECISRGPADERVISVAAIEDGSDVCALASDHVVERVAAPDYFGVPASGASQDQVFESGTKAPATGGDNRVDAARIGKDIAARIDVSVVAQPAVEGIGANTAVERVVTLTAY